MTSKDSSLYGGLNRPRNLTKGKEISSASTLSFTSQLSSLISASNASSTNTSSTPTSTGRARSKKDDIFASHNRNTAKRAKRDLEADLAGTFEQKHTTNGEKLDPSLWERSKRKMEAKARLYAAMKRGDVQDEEERYAVDFDRKWAEAEGKDDGEEEASSGDDDHDAQDEAEVEYVDEFGRTRTGTRRAAERARYASMRGNKHTSGQDEGVHGRPNAPTNIIYGDTIQHQAFDPDAPRAAAMASLAAKRDRSLTPPPEQHFDSSKEIRTKGTGFFQFSSDGAERAQQMANLEQDRAETERKRAERVGKLDERKRAIEARRQQIQQKSAKRKADEFLEALGREMGVGFQRTEEDEEQKHEEMGKADIEHNTQTDMTARIAAAIEREKDDT